MKCMKVLVHQQPYKEILRCFGLEKLFSLRWSSSSWFLLGLICLWIATLEIVLSNHTWNMIISSKPCFVIIKIKINQTLVSQSSYVISFHKIYILNTNSKVFFFIFCAWNLYFIFYQVEHDPPNDLINYTKCHKDICFTDCVIIDIIL